MTALQNYIYNHKIRDITVGKSGADVCELSESRIVEYVHLCIGHAAGEIAFYHSRLHADGCPVTRDILINLYCGNPQVTLNPQDIDVQIRLSNMNTTFLFWHEYLHDIRSNRFAIFLVP